MPRPCLCDGPTCPLCVTWHKHPDSPAARAWRGETVAAIAAARKPPPAAAGWLAAGPCAHRGAPTGEVRDCQTCGGKVPVPVIACGRHGLCHATLGKSLPGVPCCQTCPDQAAEVVPGVVDPLPGPWRQPGPWCADPAEDARHAASLRELATRRLEEPDAWGTGVVICAEGKYGPMAAAAVRLLRGSGCRLPVEVWTRPWAGRLDRSLFAGLDVDVIDAGAHGQCRIPRRSGLGGWSSKLHALAHTGFRHVVFLDADCFPLADLSFLGELAKAHGFAYWSEPTDNEAWGRLGIDPATAPPAVQGGQLGLDRVACWREVALARWMCQHEDYYWPAGRPHVLFGDQSAWRVAFALTGRTPHVIGACDYHSGVGYSYRAGGRLVASHPCLAKPAVLGYPGEAHIGRAVADVAAATAKHGGARLPA